MLRIAAGDRGFVFSQAAVQRAYTFPWDFRGVQLPLITVLRDQLRDNHFALWNPYSYCGYPIFANIQACFFHPLVFASALISSRFSWSSLPMLLEWVVVLQVWIGGVAAYHLFRAFALASSRRLGRRGDVRNRQLFRLARRTYRFNDGGGVDAAGVAARSGS